MKPDRRKNKGNDRPLTGPTKASMMIIPFTWDGASCMGSDSGEKAASAANFDGRMAPLSGPFTALFAEGGLRPGIHAGFWGQQGLLDRGGVLSAAFTRLPRPGRRSLVNRADHDCAPPSGKVLFRLPNRASMPGLRPLRGNARERAYNHHYRPRSYRNENGIQTFAAAEQVLVVANVAIG
jgi:hypothetical protein